MKNSVIAKRFIFAKKETKAINIITAISIAGIVIGVAVICVVLSVLNGFRSVVSNLFLTIDGNVQLVAREGQTIRASDETLKSLRALPEVASAERFIEGKVLMAAKEKSSVVILKAIEPTAVKQLTGYMDIRRGLGERDLAIGGGVANRLGAMHQHEVVVISAKAIDEGLEAIQNPLSKKPPELPAMKIANFFRTHRAFDETYALASLGAGRRIFGYEENEVTGIDIRPKKDVFGKPLSNEALRAAIEKWAKENGYENALQILTIEDKFSDLFRVMKMEKWGSFAALLLIIVVASFSLIGSLTMTAIEKRRDLYFLRCIGLTAKDIERIFLIEGALIGAIGVGIGVALGFLVAFLQSEYGLVKLPYGNAFIVKAYPVAIEAWDFVWTAVVAFLLTLLASLYPARRAAFLSEKLSANRE
ncbi:MAG: FtsX-like permease family protein [Chloroherpetonaceae bacterium]|nr:FtsX-like permease family protein [Chloroherpetonaceae bacterium]MDW8437536.1 FtsX-like permease family protein [Chloroherpetonaceae bacterium]